MRRTKRTAAIDLPVRQVTAFDRWFVAYNRITHSWYARPRAVGVWATTSAPLLFFPTLVAAGDYARNRTHNR